MEKSIWSIVKKHPFIWRVPFAITSLPRTTIFCSAHGRAIRSKSSPEGFRDAGFPLLSLPGVLRAWVGVRKRAFAFQLGCLLAIFDPAGVGGYFSSKFPLYRYVTPLGSEVCFGCCVLLSIGDLAGVSSLFRILCSFLPMCDPAGVGGLFRMLCSFIDR
jgi:hypothetical protein